MHSNGLQTHRPVKILHSAAIFAACAARNPSQKTRFLPGGHFETANQLCENHRFAMNSYRSRETIITKRNSPIGNIILRSLLRSQKLRRDAISSWNAAAILRDTTVHIYIYIWPNSGRQWKTGGPGVLWSMESWRVGHNLTTCLLYTSPSPRD